MPPMAIFSSPLKATAIVLPILMLMDIFAHWADKHNIGSRSLDRVVQSLYLLGVITHSQQYRPNVGIFGRRPGASWRAKSPLETEPWITICWK